LVLVTMVVRVGLVVGMTGWPAGDSTAPVVRMVTAGAVRLATGAIRR
jgi:hypothetical protein